MIITSSRPRFDCIGSRKPESMTRSSSPQSSVSAMEDPLESQRPTQSMSIRPSTSLCRGWESITSTFTTFTMPTPRSRSNTPSLRWPSLSSECLFRFAIHKPEHSSALEPGRSNISDSPRSQHLPFLGHTPSTQSPPFRLNTRPSPWTLRVSQSDS